MPFLIVEALAPVKYSHLRLVGSAASASSLAS